MIRYLKYIFLIFGSMALAVMGFFVFQNKKDLKLAWEYWDRLDYDTMSEECSSAPGNYYYPCFKTEFEDFLKESGLTGVGIGLKLAFNFMDEDKASTELFQNEKLKNLNYSLNYLEINNLAIDQSYRRFYGFQKMYGGYLSSLRDFLDGAKKFSDSLVEGLESEEGIASVEDVQKREDLAERFKRLKNNYEKAYSEARGFVDEEIETFLEKAQGS